MRATVTGRPCLGHAALAMITAAVALTATACASTASSTSAAPPASRATAATTPQAAASPSESMAETAGTIGTDCGMIPAAGMGSMHGMAMDPVVTAASHNPLITTLAAEIMKADLTATLNSAKSITVFAPDNQAFKNLTAHDMTMMSGMTELAKILKYHVVTERITPAELAHGMTLTTLEGSQLKTSRMGSVYEVNNADVTCGNLHTANATVYIINTVLMPPH
ncbi:MAG TPA: fasciclin domain-containing protein [Streptosporangiaceae bacterium]|nr:fasciclin domain-containing protein [Streptosporangiaceae bacterium]